MDASKLLELHDALVEQRELEAMISLTGDEAERRDLTNALRNLRRRTQTLERNVTTTYNSNFVECRDVGHRWVQDNADFDEGDNLIRTLVCERCTAQRIDVINRIGDLVRRVYVHAEDYLLEPNPEAPIRYPKSFWRGITYMQSRT